MTVIQSYRQPIRTVLPPVDCVQLALYDPRSVMGTLWVAEQTLVELQPNVMDE